MVNFYVPPDRKSLVNINFLKEPKDWFQNIPENPEKVEYEIDQILVLTTKESGRYDKFLEKNKKETERFLPYYGRFSKKDPNKAIFDNYIDILTSAFKESDVISIIEDDVELLPGWEKALKDSMYNLPKDWDTLSGNFSYIDKIVQSSENLIKPVGMTSSMNFTIFHKRSFPKIKENLHLRNSQRHKHIDRYCFSDEVGINFYGTWPMICREFPGYSSNRKVSTSGFNHLMETMPYKYWFIDKPKWEINN